MAEDKTKRGSWQLPRRVALSAGAAAPECGAGNEARTRDLNLGKVALYQLSYSRSDICCFVYLRRRNYYGFNRVRQVFCFYFFKNLFEFFPCHFQVVAH